MITISTETIKGIWAIAGTIVAAIVSWIGWSIKDNINRKKTDQLFQDNQSKFNNNITHKLDSLINYNIKQYKAIDKRLDNITEGVQLALECNKITFKAFHESGILNGDSVEANNRIDNYISSLAKKTLQGDEVIENIIDDITNEKVN